MGKHATATISITDDDVAEPTETVTFALSNPTNGAVLSAQNTAILTITDDEPIRGTSRNETLRGTPGNDLLLGLGGNDRLLGLEGDDTLDGGAGRDRLVGGAGADRFVYSGRNQRAAFSQSQLILRSRDRIVDFNFDQGDRILLDFDNNLSSRNRPRRLFNAGEQDADNLRLAARAAYADKTSVSAAIKACKPTKRCFLDWGAELSCLSTMVRKRSPTRTICGSTSPELTSEAMMQTEAVYELQTTLRRIFSIRRIAPVPQNRVGAVALPGSGFSLEWMAAPRGRCGIGDASGRSPASQCVGPSYR
ncbi:calcium-binding protein [Candidatus Gracilibacteria bacterium]|nr:calcium-binding protein [Candidatus Gracilibacteria bacterium]